MVEVNKLASSKLSCVPVSNQENPLPKCSTFNNPRSKYAWLTPVISNSPLALGFNCFAISTTLLS